MFQVYSNTYSTVRVLAAKAQTGAISRLNLMSFARQIILLKILCQFASERKSVPAEFFFKLNQLSFSPSLLFCASTKSKETFRTFLSSKKLKINNWVVLAVQRQIISQMLVLKIIFQKKELLHLLYSATQKTFILAASFDINAT